ncbi:FtsQ-type POTRA domain-containing protein [Subtercola sp. RTI3]|uniref:FtsQ-type POTRA domain-containing protein n=1 Tax=Subtercola sp. RTI3 TaxID=3048639 RepID=UPI002B2366A4|nr:FtsQ-type POTRA domain-containing protein [Subtercola sp. RTI3]
MVRDGADTAGVDATAPAPARSSATPPRLKTTRWQTAEPETRTADTEPGSANATPATPGGSKPGSTKPIAQNRAAKPPTSHPQGATPASADSAAPRPTAKVKTAIGAPPSRSRSDEALARKNVRVAERRRRRYERAESRRFTERSRRRRLTWLISLGTLVGLIVVVVVTAYSPLFAVRSVSITGTSRIDAAQVEAALSGQVGRPLALVDYGSIQSQLAAFPLIQSYSTESQLPNTLVIRVVERQPVGSIVSASGAGFDLVDPAGVVVEHSDARPAGFALIDLAGTPVGSPGFLAATTVLRTLPADLLANVDSISAATPDSVTMVLGGVGQKVIWGSSANSALKARVLDKLITTQSANEKLTYDVSSPESPVVE